MTISKVTAGSNFLWTMVSSSPISEEVAKKSQEEAGYHPGGYDFFSFSCTQSRKTGNYQATWMSQNNCD